MQSHSPFFQTLHDEQAPTGHLGDGTHASILRAIVFRDANLHEISRGEPKWKVPEIGWGVEADFAIIWDADHDTRVIKAVEAIYQAGFLSSILMIGERRGTLHAIVLGQTQPKHLEAQLHRYLEEQLQDVAQSNEGDPWSSSLRTLADPGRQIIDDDDDKVRLYLANLKMLWRLGVRVSIDHYLRLRTVKKGTYVRGSLGVETRAREELNQQTAARLRRSSTRDCLDAAEFQALWNAVELYPENYPERDDDNSTPEIRLVETEG
jgi:hypothetical protein